MTTWTYETEVGSGIIYDSTNAYDATTDVLSGNVITYDNEGTASVWSYQVKS